MRGNELPFLNNYIFLTTEVSKVAEELIKAFNFTNDLFNECLTIARIMLFASMYLWAMY